MSISTFKSKKESLTLRPPEPEDWDRIVELWKQHDFPMPDFDNILTQAIVTNEEGDVVAYGFVKKFTEAVFVPDLNQRKRTIVGSLDLLHDAAVRDTRAFGINQLHVFSWLKGFADILKKRFGYSTSKGESLVLEINNGEGRPETDSE